jgi:hypothetical protein
MAKPPSKPDEPQTAPAPPRPKRVYPATGGSTVLAQDGAPKPDTKEA